MDNKDLKDILSNVKIPEPGAHARQQARDSGHGGI